MRFVITLLVLASLAAACSEPLAEDAPAEEIYSNSCAACHGRELQGRSGPPLGGEFAPSLGREKSYFIDTVTKGRSRMPAFRTLLTKDQIERVVEYVISRQEP